MGIGATPGGRGTGEGLARQADGAAWQVEIEIGRLLLDGFDRIDRDAVAAAFGRELTRLLRRGAVVPGADGAPGIELASLGARLPAVPLPAGTSPGRLGRSLAGAVFGVLGGLGKAARPPAPAVWPDNAARGTHGEAVSRGPAGEGGVAAAGAPGTVPRARGAEAAAR